MGKASLGTVVRVLGALVLVFGLTAAVWLYCDATGQPESAPAIDEETGLEGGLHPEDFKGYSRSMEVFGGKIWLMLAALRRALASLGQGRPLAVLVGIGAVAVGVYLLRAGRQPVTPDATDRADQDNPGPPANGA